MNGILLIHTDTYMQSGKFVSFEWPLANRLIRTRMSNNIVVIVFVVVVVISICFVCLFLLPETTFVNDLLSILIVKLN